MFHYIRLPILKRSDFFGKHQHLWTGISDELPLHHDYKVRACFNVFTKQFFDDLKGTSIDQHIMLSKMINIRLSNTVEGCFPPFDKDDKKIEKL
jgi:hypothetical protein